MPLNKSREKMAMIPKGADLLYNPITKAAGFKIKNVYVMAGVPEIMKAMFKKIITKLKSGTPIISKTILINTAESNIADNLSIIQNKFKKVEIGSYPFMNNKKRAVNIVLRSKNKKQINNVTKEMTVKVLNAKCVCDENGRSKSTCRKLCCNKNFGKDVICIRTSFY